MRTNLPADFTHLRVHSHYTLMGATASVPELVNRAVQDGYTSLALTDENALYGAVALAQACKEAGIKPILGMTLAIAAPSDHTTVAMGTPGEISLLAMGLSGYRSLCRLTSMILGDPLRAGPRGRVLTWDELKEHHGGLICLENGRRGWLFRFLRADESDNAARYVAQLAGVFGDHCYLSLEIHQPEDHVLAAEVVALGHRFGLGSVAAQPIYCLHPDDIESLTLLAAIRDNCLLADLPATAVPGSGDTSCTLHWPEPEAFANRYASFPEALDQVGEVVRRCEPALPEGKPIWPSLDLAEDHSLEETLKKQALDGLDARYGPDPGLELLKRLEHEHQAIADRGYSPLFLVVADIVRFARQAEIPVNTRGSVANSLVAYCLYITNVDPIAHDLLFERFLNPARSDLPDIDLDFCSRRREEILEYVREKYGHNKVALVSTINSLRPRSAIRETAKAYGLDEAEIKKLTAQLPRGWRPGSKHEEKRPPESLLSKLHDERIRELVYAGYRIVGQPRHLSVHPGGIIITPSELTDVVPVQWAPKGFLITQFDHSDLETIGLPKIDLLGIRALTVLADAARLVRSHFHPEFRLPDIPLGDAATGDLLARGETIGVFQSESEGAQRTLRQLLARTIQDLAVANAFFKPGPATGGMAKAFVRRYRGEETVSYLHPALEPILSRTKGVLIFQEQILRLAREIAGLSWEEADYLRRGMSRFRPDEMQAMQSRFVTGCQRMPPEGSGLDAKQAETLWEQVEAFAGYGFNQGHATAYADVSYRMAYLKAHYPAAFLCARLADRGGYHHPAVYLAEATRLGLEIRPPHINISDLRFTLTYGNEAEQSPLPVLWMGLDQVRDLRRKTILTIQKERETGIFTSLRDFTNRVPLQDRELTHLIQSGGLDGLAPHRAALLAEVASHSYASKPYQRSFDFPSDVQASPETLAQRLEWEQHVLGFPVSVHPLQLVKEAGDDITPLRDLPTKVNQKVVIRGTRLPGWSRRESFFLSDGDTFVRVKMNETLSQNYRKPPPWEPIALRGIWRVDLWGSGWFSAEEVDTIQKG